jgi:serine/threonine protein kinase
MTPTPPPPQKTATSIADGRYLLVQKIAEGGTAVVYKAFDTVDQQWRAIKTLLPDYAKRPALRNRFEREAKTMQQLQHPNIIQVYDAGGDHETAFLVMEYADGGSVIDWVERHGRPMPPRMATQVALELCAGIHYAHEEGVIHRDIKPQNLLVDRYGVCKVTDFGIAQVVANEVRMTMTGTVMGTIGYMSPEQHESAKHADERADVYSIAATLYTLVHGEAATHLFMAEDRDFEGIPTPLAEVIRKGSQYRREARYATVAEMARALREAEFLLPMDDVLTPPIVQPNLMPVGEQPPPNFGNTRTRGDGFPSDSLDSFEPASEIDQRLQQRTPLDLDSRTPSSIIPRHSLTGPTGERRRRPRIQNRDDLERQVRVRRAAWVAAILTAVTFLGVLMVSLVAANRIKQAEHQEEMAYASLRDQIGRYARLPDWVESSDLKRDPEIRAAIERLIVDPDPGYLDTGALQLTTLLSQELRELEDTDKVSAKMWLKGAVQKIEEYRLAHVRRTEEVDAARDGPLGYLGDLLLTITPL